MRAAINVVTTTFVVKERTKSDPFHRASVETKALWVVFACAKITPWPNPQTVVVNEMIRKRGKEI